MEIYGIKRNFSEIISIVTAKKNKNKGKHESKQL
jgi:hypothetical protein